MDGPHAVPDTPPGQHGVVIITNPPKKQLSEPADYNANSFDPIAHVAAATALAQKLIPDARLVSFEFDPVYPDGHVDLTASMARDHEYEFRSASASARPPGQPANVPLEQGCRIHVEVTASGMTAAILDSDCKAPFVRLPRCRFAQVWERALAANKATRDVVVRIGWLSDQKWFFDTDPYSSGKGGVESFADDCR